MPHTTTAVKAKALANNASEREAILGAQVGDPAATEALIRHYTPHVYKLASAIGRQHGVDVEDLFQEGIVTLLESTLTYVVEGDRPAILWTVARFPVRGRMTELAQQTTYAVHVPSGTLRNRSGLGARGALSLEHAEMVRASIVPGDQDEDTAHGTVSADTIVDDRSGVTEGVDTRATAQHFLAMLPPREARVVRMALGFDGSGPMTDAEVADIMGVERSRVNRIRNRAINRLRDAAMAEAMGLGTPEVTELVWP